MATSLVSNEVESTIWLDLTDIFSWYVFNSFPTGIRQFIEACLRSKAFRGNPRLRYCYVQNRWRILEIPNTLVERFLSCDSNEFNVALEEIRAQYVEGRDDTPKFQQNSEAKRRWWHSIFQRTKVPEVSLNHLPQHCRPRNGDAFLVLGAFWGRCSLNIILPKLKKDNTKIITMIHDISPVTHPHFHPEDVTKQFKESLFIVLKFSDTILCPSNHTLDSISRYLESIKEELSDSVCPVLRKIEMPECFTSLIPNKAEVPPAKEALQFLESGNEFVLIVSTLEPRKNHQCAIDAWHHLFLQSREKCPHLVLIGKQGWLNEFTMARLRELNYLDGKILYFRALPSDLVDRFYRQCIFTLFPSYDEGFGLPVTESLSRGKHCLTADIPVLRENGKNVATYFDPYDSKDLATRVKMILSEIRSGQRPPPIMTPNSNEECGRSIMVKIGSFTL